MTGQDEPVALDVWRKLYAAAGKVKEIEPWVWMEETDIFGVEVPDSDTLLFVSVMGLIGEYPAVALYVGTKGVTEFWRMQELSRTEDIADMMVGIRQIHAAFGAKGELESDDKRIIKELALSFRGAKAWPYFRSFRPGYFPWMIDTQEARWLIMALEQLMDVAPRVKGDRRILARKPGTCTYLVRVSEQKGDVSVWRDERRECPPPPATRVEISVSTRLLDAVRGMQTSDATYQLDMASSPMPIGEKGARPQMPYMMLAVDSASGLVLGHELLTVSGTMEDMWTQVPSKFLDIVAKTGKRPRKITIRSSLMFSVMEGVCRDLGIEIVPDPELRMLTQVRQELERFAMR